MAVFTQDEIRLLDKALPLFRKFKVFTKLELGITPQETWTGSELVQVDFIDYYVGDGTYKVIASTGGAIISTDIEIELGKLCNATMDINSTDTANNGWSIQVTVGGDLIRTGFEAGTNFPITRIYKVY